MFVYHTLPELTSVGPNTVNKLFNISICSFKGGVEGGTHLKIQGTSFDGYQGATTVSTFDHCTMKLVSFVHR